MVLIIRVDSKLYSLLARHMPLNLAILEMRKSVMLKRNGGAADLMAYAVSYSTNGDARGTQRLHSSYRLQLHAKGA